MDAAKKNGKIKVIYYKENGGKGSALKNGFKYCSGRYVTFIDADLDLHPKQLTNFITYIENTETDVVVGSKRHPLSKINYPKTRKILSEGYHLITKALFHLDITDTQTGLKLFKYEVLEDTLPKIICKKYAFDLELLVNINYHGWKIDELPIKLEWQRNKNRLKINDIWKLSLDTASIFYRYKILKKQKNKELLYKLKIPNKTINVEK